METQETGDWQFDEFFGIYVMHHENRVMYHDGQQWIHGDYDQFYTTAQPTTSTHSIRLVVDSSPVFEAGKVALIDENGLTIGRDRSWDRRLRLPEMAVSKYHATIFLNPSTDLFYLVDAGSQHGTFVNDQRLSESKQSSMPYRLEHLDRIEIGSTCFQVHLHSRGPCEVCLAQTFIDVSCGKKEKKPAVMQELAVDRREWIQHYKQDYQIRSIPTDESYIDRAELRRSTTVDATPLPVPDRKIPSPHIPRPPSPPKPVQGVGNTLLRKLGWQEGQSLGKYQTGIKEPIQLSVQTDRAGLGMRK